MYFQFANLYFEMAIEYKCSKIYYLMMKETQTNKYLNYKGKFFVKKRWQKGRRVWVKNLKKHRLNDHFIPVKKEDGKLHWQI